MSGRASISSTNSFVNLLGSVTFWSIRSTGNDRPVALNNQAKGGWKVKNSGTIESGTEVIFWALLEKE